MLIYGDQNPDQTADAKRIYRQLERFHPAPASAQGPPSGLVEMPVKSTLDGSALLGQIGQPIEDSIVTFLTTRVTSQELPWSKRRNRLN